ncbi:MAG: phytoene desaturase family protein [Nocardioidaceae bacterium]
MRTGEHDAIVIGSGPNGLVAANVLADAGWSVLVLEAQDTLGGAVRSDTEVAPGFVHDTFSSFYPLGKASAAITALGLEDYGLVWRQAPAVLANPLPGGRWAVLHQRPADTAAGFDALHAGDGDAWLELCAVWERLGGPLMDCLLKPFPPVAAGSQLLAKGAGRGGMDLARMLVVSARQLGEERFGGDAPRTLLAGNALHADFSPESTGSGVFGLIMSMLGQFVGFPVPEGGAGRLTQAMADRLADKGSTVRTSARVDEVLVSSGRAVGVRTSDGAEQHARRAILADVVAPQLFGGLVPWEALPGRVRRGMRRFRWDPSTFKVDWALSGPVPWSVPQPVTSACVHVTTGVDELSMFAAHLAAGAVPSHPLLLTGQMAQADPTRAPAGKESMWAYTHVPRDTRSDAGADGLTGRWDQAEKERFADRVQARVEEHAPGFGDLVEARRILGPADLEARDCNLDRGAINGGTSALHQELVFRPYPGTGRPETPVRGLFLAGASAHPGGGVHGAAGANAARAALLHARLRRI